MKQLLTLTGLAAIGALILLTSNVSYPAPPATTEESSQTTTMSAEQEIRAANDRLYEGLNAMFTGDLEPLNKLWSHSDNITYMGPFGGQLIGWKAVHADFAKVAAMKLGGKIVCKDLHVFAGMGMGYTICVEAGENIGEDGQPVKVSHRATNIFHLENGEWKLVHHHTDISLQLEEAFEGGGQ